MYKLMVYHPGDQVARAAIKVERAADVLAMIPQVLAEHHGCEHIVVFFDHARLFAVDCHGNRTP